MMIATWSGTPLMGNGGGISGFVRVSVAMVPISITSWPPKRCCDPRELNGGVKPSGMPRRYNRPRIKINQNKLLANCASLSQCPNLGLSDTRLPKTRRQARVTEVPVRLARFLMRGGVAVLGLVLLAYGVSPPADLQATQAPRISLDMVTSGNSYDDATNTMTVGSVDNCLTTDLPGNNGQHNHTAHLVVQDVEDLVGWQARLNYDGGRMRPSNVNFTPFTDGNTGQNVSFLNLPLEGGSHRSLVAAQTIPPEAAGPQTALVGAVYGAAQGSAVSPDTPAKATPDDTSYSAPSSAVLAAVNLQVLAGQAEMPGLYIDLDDADPNPPGSEIVVFTGSGTTSVSLPESDLGDGFHGEGVPCVPVAPPAVPLPPPAPSAGASAQSASPDSDTDGFSDSLEPAVGTDPMRPCGIDGWPPDIDNDTFVDTADMAPLTSNFGNAVPPAQARYDISDPPSGFVDTVDLAAMTSRFGTQCASSEALLAMRGCRTDPTHRWAIAISGAGGTVQGTRVWTFTPSGGW